MPNPGRGKGSTGKRRAVLLLSLILLVWNVAATARHPAPIGLPPAIGRVDGAPVLPHPLDDRAGTHPAEIPRGGPLSIRQKYLLGKRIDINTASPGEIAELPGISAEVAAAWVEERERLGGFRSPEDLLGVKGIKGKRLQKILPFLSKMPNN